MERFWAGDQCNFTASITGWKIYWIIILAGLLKTAFFFPSFTLYRERKSNGIYWAYKARARDNRKLLVKAKKMLWIEEKGEHRGWIRFSEPLWSHGGRKKRECMVRKWVGAIKDYVEAWTYRWLSGGRWGGGGEMTCHLEINNPIWWSICGLSHAVRGIESDIF